MIDPWWMGRYEMALRYSHHDSCLAELMVGPELNEDGCVVPLPHRIRAQLKNSRSLQSVVMQTAQRIAQLCVFRLDLNRTIPPPARSLWINCRPGLGLEPREGWREANVPR